MPRMAKIFWIKVTFLKDVRFHTILFIWEVVFFTCQDYQDITRDYSSQRSPENFGKRSKRALESSI